MQQGGLITLTLNVVPDGASGDNFAFAITGTTIGSTTPSIVTGSTIKGVKNNQADLLSYTAGTNTGWTYTVRTGATRPGNYYDTAALPWAAGTQTKTFSMTIGAATPVDVYSLTYRVSGTNAWTESQEFLINVVPVPEPAVLSLVALSGVGLMVFRCRRRS